MLYTYMSRIVLNETFSNETLHPLLKWMNPPSRWFLGQPNLAIEPDGETDFWQQTHYGFRADNGHFLYAEILDDVIATTQIRYRPAHQYDQAGLMVRYSSECWLKASTEYERDAPSKLGAVATNAGFSDWSLQDFPYTASQSDGILSYCLRLHRRANDILVEHAPDQDGPWKLMRVAHLLYGPKDPCQIGIYACSPKESGCRVDVAFLRIEAP